MTAAIPLLKHNPSVQDPGVLERITVQREDLVSGLVASALQPGPPVHTLILGPRGMGKTHTLSLLHSRLAAHPQAEEVTVAWLDEDPWALRTYGKLVAAVVSRVARALRDPELERRAGELWSSPEAEAADEGERLLREAVGKRRLLLLVENLDQIFRKIGSKGQERFRRFVDSWEGLLIFATATHLFDSVAKEAGAFYGVFRTSELEELTVTSAMELMRRVAELNDDRALASYLQDDQAENRFRAIEALAGGHPRIWLLFSGCISVEAIDELVPMFLEALDDLTPYYQDRIRELGDQQQELVVLLGEAAGALSNRELAEQSGIPQNQVATMLGQLADRGYVRPATLPDDLGVGDKRLSFWELREPLMRLCLEVKQTRGEPLRLVIEFLKAWYGSKILDQLVRLPADATLAASYAGEAFRSLGDEISVDDVIKGSPSEFLARAEVAHSLVPGRFDFQMAKATGLLLEERFEEALPELEQLQEKTVSEVTQAGISLLALVAQQGLGETVPTEKVSANLTRVIESEPDNGDVLGFLGDVASGFKLWEEALEAYTKGAELKPDDVELRAGRGRALRYLDRHEEALESFEAVVELEPKVAAHHFQRGVELSNLRRFDDAIAAFDEAIALDPGAARYRASRGIALRYAGRVEDALGAFDTAIAIEPDDSSLHERRAALLADLDRPEEAREEFDRALELNPANATAQRNLGSLWLREGEYRKALEAFSKAADLVPEKGSYRWDRGFALHCLHRYEEAVESIDEALELGASGVSLWNTRGSSLTYLDRHQEALESFEKAQELEPENAVVKANRGSALGNLGRWTEALEAFESALEDRPEDADLHHRLGKALADLERFEDALAAFDRALEIDAEDPDFHNHKADTLRAIGRFQGAEQAARRAVDLGPAASVYRFTLAEAILSAKEVDRGLAALRDALTVWRGEPRAKPGEPNLICQILWDEFRTDPERRDVMAAIVDAYRSVGALDALSQGVVASIPLFVAEGVEDGEAARWVEDWEAVGRDEQFGIGLGLLRTALEWRGDRDRAHLMKLPREQRDILVELLRQGRERN